eukprot:147372-Prymnesium_polylepis.2
MALCARPTATRPRATSRALGFPSMTGAATVSTASRAGARLTAGARLPTQIRTRWARHSTRASGRAWAPTWARTTTPTCHTSVSTAGRPTLVSSATRDFAGTRSTGLCARSRLSGAAAHCVQALGTQPGDAFGGPGRVRPVR